MSHVVKKGALQHPLQSACEDLMKSSPEMYKIWQQVHSQARVLGKKTPALVPAGIVDWAKKEGQYAKLRDIATKFLAKENLARDGVKKMSMAPPKASELYERVEPGVDLVDVGVGDGKRLARYAGYFGKVIGVDKVKREMVPEWPVNWSTEIGAFGEVNVTVTSFMAYAQLDLETKNCVENTDGIHIVPDHDALRKVGAVQDLKEGLVECDMGGLKFVERDVSGIGGEGLSTYYKGYNTYVKRELRFVPKAKSTFNPAGQRYYRRMERDLFLTEFTPKYDGVFMELISRKGKFVLKNRA